LLTNKQEKALFYPTLPDLLDNVRFGEVPKIRPFVLLLMGNVWMKMNMEQWWNGNDKGRPKYP
jgi:hypothetical protein